MNILCSAGKGQMTTEQCLACARTNGGPPCGFDYAILKAMFSSSSAESRRNEIHVTDLTGCLRKAWYDKLDPTPSYVHDMLVLWLGTAIHANTESSDEFLTSEMEIAYGGITGRADIVYKDGRLLDIKTTRWLTPQKLPYGSHALQVNIYAWMLRKSRRAVSKMQIQYIDTSGPSKCRKCKVAVRNFDGELKCPQCFQYVPGAHLGAVLVDVGVMRNEEVEAIILPRRNDLDAALQMGIPPAKEPGYLCGYCAHYEKCKPEEA